MKCYAILIFFRFFEEATEVEVELVVEEEVEVLVEVRLKALGYRVWGLEFRV